jgi:hypothetical protein
MTVCEHPQLTRFSRATRSRWRNKYLTSFNKISFSVRIHVERISQPDDTFLPTLRAKAATFEAPAERENYKYSAALRQGLRHSTTRTLLAEQWQNIRAHNTQSRDLVQSKNGGEGKNQ